MTLDTHFGDEHFDSQNCKVKYHSKDVKDDEYFKSNEYRGKQLLKILNETDKEKFDIHDRVNYAVTGSSLKVEAVDKRISLNLQIDESICTMYEYFDIFLGRMMMCRAAAQMLGASFRLTVNGAKVL